MHLFVLWSHTAQQNIVIIGWGRSGIVNLMHDQTTYTITLMSMKGWDLAYKKYIPISMNRFPEKLLEILKICLTFFENYQLFYGL